MKIHAETEPGWGRTASVDVSIFSSPPFPQLSVRREMEQESWVTEAECDLVAPGAKEGKLAAIMGNS